MSTTVTIAETNNAVTVAETPTTATITESQVAVTVSETNITAIIADTPIAVTVSAPVVVVTVADTTTTVMVTDDPPLTNANVAALIHTATAKSPPSANDEFVITDSAATYGLKKVLWSVITGALDVLYAAIGHTHASSAHVIQDEGTPLAAQPNLNFAGAGVTATNDAGNSATLVTVPGGVTDHGAMTGLADDDHTQYSLVAGTRAFTGDVRGKDFVGTRAGTITRDGNGYITSVAKTGGRTLTITRDGNNYISSITDGTNTWTFTRDGNGLISSWAVT